MIYSVNKHNEPVVIVQIKKEPTEHYTNVEAIQRNLLDAMAREIKVQLLTTSCRSGDRGFAMFEMYQKNVHL